MIKFEEVISAFGSKEAFYEGMLQWKSFGNALLPSEITDITNPDEAWQYLWDYFAGTEFDRWAIVRIWQRLGR